MHSLVTDIGLAIIFSAAIGALFLRFRLPLILAYLAAGVVLGSAVGFNLIGDHETIATLSEIGLVFLMFILGMEIDVAKILKLGTAVLLNGVTQFVGCGVLAVAFFWGLGYAHAFGDYGLLYLAVSTSLSSTLIVVKVLSDRMELDTLTSRVTLGILVLQDVWAITFLAIQPRINNLTVAALAISIGSALLLLSVGVGLAKYALPTIFLRVAKNPEVMLITAIGWCSVMGGLAILLHLSVEMGALFAGVCIASFPYHSDIAAKIAPLRDFFVTIYFVTLGLQIPKPTVPLLFLTLVVTAFVIISRVITVFPVLHLLKYGNRASLVPAINLGQVSEFSLVLAGLGVGYGHITKDLLSGLVMAMTVTALLSSMTIPKSHDLYRLANPWLERLGLRDRASGEDIEGGVEHGHGTVPPLVLLGFYREASSLVAELTRRGSETALKNIMVVDFNPESLQRLRGLGIRCEYGDISHPETLAHLDLKRAKTLLCTLPDHLLKGTNNLQLVRVLRALAPEATIVVTAETIESARHMYGHGADYVAIPRLISAHFMADVLEKIGTGDIATIRTSASSFIMEYAEILP